MLLAWLISWSMSKDHTPMRCAQGRSTSTATAVFLFGLAVMALAEEPTKRPGAPSQTNLPPGFGVTETPPPAPRVVSYALFVGVNAPAHLGEHLEPLRHAESDARDMSVLLGGSLESSGYDQVVILTGSEATRTAVLAELERAVSELEPGARMLVYFASHGAMTSAESDQGRRRYLLLADGDANNLAATGLDVQAMHELLVERAPAAQLVEIYDACATVERAEASRERGRGAPRPSVPALVPGVGDTPRVQLFAAADGEGTREYDDLASGLYTHYLKEALLGAGDRDGDRDGRVSAGEVQAYARARMGEGATPFVRSEEKRLGASAELTLRELERPLYVERTLPPPPNCAGCLYEATLSSFGKDGSPVPPGAIEAGLYLFTIVRRSPSTGETELVGSPVRGLTFVSSREVFDPLARLDPLAAPSSWPLWFEAGVLMDMDGDPENFVGLRPPTMPVIGLAWSGRARFAPVVGLWLSAGPSSWAEEKPHHYPGVDMMTQARIGAQAQSERLAIGAQLVASDTMHWYILPNTTPNPGLNNGLYGPDFNPGLGVGARAQFFTSAWALTVEQNLLWEWSAAEGIITERTPLGVGAITTITVGRKLDVF
jgi:hypothetical protein